MAGINSYVADETSPFVYVRDVNSKQFLLSSRHYHQKSMKNLIYDSIMQQNKQKRGIRYFYLTS